MHGICGTYYKVIFCHEKICNICAFQAESVHNSAVCGNKLMARDSRSGVRDAVTRQLLVEVGNCFLHDLCLFFISVGEYRKH